jgi:hypothetical protein
LVAILLPGGSGLGTRTGPPIAQVAGMLGKNIGQLCSADYRPMSQTTRVEMNESTIASGIIADPARLLHQSSVAQQLEGYIGKLHINGAT